MENRKSICRIKKNLISKSTKLRLIPIKLKMFPSQHFAAYILFAQLDMYFIYIHTKLHILILEKATYLYIQQSWISLYLYVIQNLYVTLKIFKQFSRKFVTFKFSILINK